MYSLNFYNFGNLFRTARKSKGLSIEEIARKINKAPSTVYKYEKNTIIPDFETVINIENSENDIVMKAEEDNLDQLNYLEGKNLSYINNQAMEGTKVAHVDGDVPNIIINIKKLNAKNIGQLIYFFELACAVSGLILGVNPFNQPGVEKYKNNMFKLLKKPGY